jgi:acetyl esterase/lipase
MTLATQHTITYRKVNDIELQMDVFVPQKSAELKPGVLFIHGGGWNGGKRSTFFWHAQQLADLGFVTASASYRFSSVAPFPAALDDCQAAIRWFRKHAVEFGLDESRVGVFGSSAGGHLVACLGVRETLDDSDPDLKGISSRAQCVVDVHGVHDLPSIRGESLVKIATLFCGGTLSEKPEVWHNASPIEFIDDKTAPTMLIHDPGDPTVPYDQSVRYATALMNAARPVSFVPSPGSKHGFVYNPEHVWTKQIWPQAVSWLKFWLGA